MQGDVRLRQAATILRVSPIRIRQSQTDAHDGPRFPARLAMRSLFPSPTTRPPRTRVYSRLTPLASLPEVEWNTSTPRV